MIQAIVTKELREIRLFALAAIGVYLIYLGKMTGHGTPFLNSIFASILGMDKRPVDVPFVQGGFLSMLGTVTAMLAIALGFRQSAWEPSQGTALYLLHMPLHRRTIYLTKVLTGIGFLLVCSLLPIVIYATWAATPGTHPGPFDWSMTSQAFRTWLVMPLVYLGAFASGIRPARWFGSRLLPLAAVPLPAILSVASPYWWLTGLPLLALTAMILVANILGIAETRDF